jgi:hypothetical protein
MDFDEVTREVAGARDVLDEPNVLEDKTEAPAEPERLDLCAPDIPLVEETASVFTEVDALLENERPEVAEGLEPVPFCDDEFCK